MKTTIIIDKSVASRLSKHANNLGDKSMSSMAQFAIKKACDFIDAYGYDKFVAIPNKKVN